jgi:ribosomal protein S26
MDYNGSWNWKVNVMPNYALLVLGLIAAYVVACLLVHYIIKLRSTKKREAKESR